MTKMMTRDSKTYRLLADMEAAEDQAVQEYEEEEEYGEEHTR